MSDLYDDFEKRYTNAWFSVGWAEIEKKQVEKSVLHKDLHTLEGELEQLKENIELINHKQLRLSNLAKLYQI